MLAKVCIKALTSCMIALISCMTALISLFMFMWGMGERLSPLQAGVMPGDRTKSVRSFILCIQVEKHRKRDERSTDRVTIPDHSLFEMAVGVAIAN